MFYSILRPHPYDIQVEDGEAGSKMTMVAIARGHDENRIVSVVCEMVETEIGGALHWEFSFSIDVFALDGGIEPFRTQERQMAAPFIPDSIRASVMAVVCESLKCLANHVNPMLIYWVTKDREPPEKGPQEVPYVKGNAGKCGIFATLRRNRPVWPAFLDHATKSALTLR